MERLLRWSLCVAALVTVLGAAAPARADYPVSMSPHRLVLNAVGQFESVQANVGIVLPAGYAIVYADFALAFDDVEVSRTGDVEYCAIDDILHVFFDRAALQANPDVKAMADQVVDVTVAGLLLLSDGVTTLAVEIVGYDTMEIVGPGKAGR